MLIDDIRQLIKELEPDITAIQTFWRTSGTPQRHDELQKIMHQEDFWQHPDNIAISQEFEGLKNMSVQYAAITKVETVFRCHSLCVHKSSHGGMTFSPKW